MKDYYFILQVVPDASEEVIKASYKALAKKYHPDSGIDSNDERMKEINEAYDTLINPDKRAMYDRMRSSANESKSHAYHDNSPKPSDFVYENSYDDFETRDTLNDKDSILMTAPAILILLGVSYYTKYGWVKWISLFLGVARWGGFKGYSGFHKLMTIIVTAILLIGIFPPFIKYEKPNNTTTETSTVNEVSSKNESTAAQDNKRNTFTFKPNYLFLDDSSSIRDYSKGLPENWGSFESSLMMDEILARHGVRVDVNNTVYRFFKNQSWYEPYKDFNDFDPTELTDIERNNIITFKNKSNFQILNTSKIVFNLYIEEDIANPKTIFNIFIDNLELHELGVGQGATYDMLLPEGVHTLEVKTVTTRCRYEIRTVTTEHVTIDGICTKDRDGGIKLIEGCPPSQYYISQFFEYDINDGNANILREKILSSPEEVINHIEKININEYLFAHNCGFILEGCLQDAIWTYEESNDGFDKICFSGTNNDGFIVKLYGIYDSIYKHFKGWDKCTVGDKEITNRIDIGNYIYELEQSIIGCDETYRSYGQNLSLK